MAIVKAIDTAKVRVHAWALDTKGKRYPYAVQSGGFWYIADCPMDYIAEGCRHIVLADLLHEFTGEDHPERHTALVRIEDVSALSDPQAIRRIADLLWSGNYLIYVECYPQLIIFMPLAKLRARKIKSKITNRFSSIFTKDTIGTAIPVR